MDIPIDGDGYSIQMKSVEVALHVPEPLMETLGRMAQYRRCSVEHLIIQLISDNTTLQKFFTKAALALWEPG